MFNVDCDAWLIELLFIFLFYEELGMNCLLNLPQVGRCLTVILVNFNVFILYYLAWSINNIYIYIQKHTTTRDLLNPTNKEAAEEVGLYLKLIEERREEIF